MANGISNLGGGAAPFWGDGSDGVLSAGATYQAGVDFDEESGFCIKQFTSIDWDPATPETLTVDKPCRGLILFSQGPVYIGQNATISMAKKGSIVPVNPECFIEMFGASAQMRHIVDVLKTLRGGAGGDGGSGRSWNGGHAGTPGTGGIGRICLGGIGGGGSGGGNGSTGGDGGSVILPEVFGHGGWAKDGWQGGGGRYSTSTTGSAPGGNPYGGGGAGGSKGLAAEGEHAGGFILIIAKGSIEISGTLDVTGGNGGSNTSGSTGTGGGGGGAGGGVIALFAQTSVDVSTATINKNGGQGGTGYQNGTGGQQGTLYTEAI
ncbi:MAG: hypothetical protein ACOYIG_09355 [Acetivibrionales bacterium]|jgi:hypothetical protein